MVGIGLHQICTLEQALEPRLIFVTGPFLGERNRANFIKIKETAAALVNRGHFPLTIDTIDGMLKETTHYRGVYSTEYQAYARRRYLESCDGVIQVGSDILSNQDVEDAQMVGIKVYKSVDELPMIGRHTLEVSA